MPAKKIILIIFVVVALLASLRSSASEFLIFQKQGRKSLPKVIVDQTPYLPIVDFLNIVDLPYSESVSTGQFQISVGKDQIKLSKDKSQALVNGTPVTLSAPVIVSNNQWLVPPEFVERVLNRVLAEKIGVSSAGDRFSVGGTGLVRLSVRPVTSEQGTRIAIQFSAPLQPEIRQEQSRMVLSLGSAAVDPGKEDYAYQDEWVRSIRFEQTASVDRLIIEFSEKGQSPRVTQLASQNIYLVEVNRAETTAEGQPAETISLVPITYDPHHWHHITVDAGHGGEDRGALIRENLFEKDVALAIARRVRWALQTKLGVEVALARSDDQLLSLEDRVVAANKARSNLFVSIHIGNATQTQESKSYAYVAKPRANPESTGDPTHRMGKLFVPWEQIQFENLTWSQRLAECLQAEMNRSLNGSNTSLTYRNAPLRLLTSLAMPAVLLELGNAGQSEFRDKVNDPQFQNLVAATVVAATEKFRAIHERP